MANKLAGQAASSLRDIGELAVPVCIPQCMEAGGTSLGGLEMRKMMNCYGVAVKWQSSYFHLLMFVSALYRVHKRSTQETVYSLGLEGMGVVVKPV